MLSFPRLKSRVSCTKSMRNSKDKVNAAKKHIRDIRFKSRDSRQLIRDLRFEIIDYFLNIIVDGVTVDNKTYVNTFWSMPALLEAIDVNPRNSEYTLKIHRKLKIEFKNRRKLANHDVETLQQIRKIKVRVNSQLFSKTISQSSPKAYYVLEISKDKTGTQHKNQCICNSLVDAHRAWKAMSVEYGTCLQFSQYAFVANNDVSQAIIIISPVNEIDE